MYERLRECKLIREKKKLKPQTNVTALQLYFFPEH